MGTQEYLLLAMTILVPLVIAVVVTLWTLEQARLRSKKNRKPVRARTESAPSPADSESSVPRHTSDVPGRTERVVGPET